MVEVLLSLQISVPGFHYLEKKPVLNLVSLALWEYWLSWWPRTSVTVGEPARLILEFWSHAHSFWAPSITMMWSMTALSLLKLRKLNDAIEDCTNAVKLDDTYIKAYLRRAQWWVPLVGGGKRELLLVCQGSCITDDEADSGILWGHLVLPPASRWDCSSPRLSL